MSKSLEPENSSILKTFGFLFLNQDDEKCHALKKHTIYPEGSSYFLGVLFRASVQETYSNKAGTQPNYTSG